MHHAPGTMLDCQWMSYQNTDSSKLDASVKQFVLHVLLEHEGSTSSPMTGGSSRGDKMQKEYLAATKLRKVEKTMDDVTSNLC